MTLERLFELIRKEDVVIWAGSGFSLYAGYPSGKELTQIIFDSLTNTEQSNVSNGMSLADIAEEFVQIKADRGQLINILTQHYQPKLAEAKYHQILPQIPHLKTIITTNYDSLFESVYGNKARKILTSADIPSPIDNVEIFKVHGDLDNPDSLIITKSDYKRFFADSTINNAYWSVVAERITSKTVLFVGYSLEDTNVQILFDKITDQLKGSRKEAFFISPGLINHKQEFLKKMKIHYLNYKAERVLEMLLKNIKENIINDFKKGFLKPDTLRRFLLINGELYPELKAGVDDKFHLKGITSKDKKTEANFSFSFKNQELGSKFTSVVQGKEFSELEIDGSSLSQMQFSIKGINLLSEGDQYKFRLQPKPKEEGSIDIVFNDGFEITDMKYMIFGSRHLVELTLEYKFIKIRGKYNLKENEKMNMDFSGEELSDIPTVKDAIDFFTFLEKAASGKQFTVYKKGSSTNFNLSTAPITTMQEDAKNNLEYFELMKKVENTYGVRFANINSLNEENLKKLTYLIKYANGQAHYREWKNELTFTVNRTISDYEGLLEYVKDGKKSFYSESQEKEIIEVHGVNIDMGYMACEILESFMVNYDEIVSGQTDKGIIRSKINKVKIHYSKSLPVFKTPP